MNDIKIRPATPDDLPILLEFEQGIVSFERPFDETLKPDPISYYDLGALIESPTTEVLVVTHNEEVIGSAYVDIRRAMPYLDHEIYGYLGFMFVKPEHRGQGVNKKIIDGLVEWSKTKELKELRLDVYDENHSAVRAYEKAGFQRHLLNMRIRI